MVSLRQWFILNPDFKASLLKIEGCISQDITFLDKKVMAHFSLLSSCTKTNFLTKRVMNSLSTYNLLTLSVSDPDCFSKKKKKKRLVKFIVLGEYGEVYCALTSWFSKRFFSPKYEVRSPIQSLNCKILRTQLMPKIVALDF